MSSRVVPTLSLSLLLPLVTLALGCNKDKDDSDSVALVDVDMDGAFSDVDCDDEDPTVFPGNPETCDGVDNNCDGDIDEDATDAVTWYIDADGDGFGAETYVLVQCEQPSGYLDVAGDCDDLRGDVFPDGPELCDGVDNDCDGVADEEGEGGTWYLDADGDGYGDPNNPVFGCVQPEGSLEDASDCDDADPAVSPDAAEICNDGIDNNCDGTTLGCEFPPTVLVGSADAVFQGAAAEDFFGAPARDIEDIDGDGAVDLAFSARGDDEGGDSAGAVYIWSGVPSGVVDTTMHVAKLLGDNAGDEAFGVWPLGDVDGDGITELAVSSQRNDEAAADAGKIYVIPGPITGTHTLSSMAVATYVGEGAGDRAGVLAQAGDTNGDGVVDLLVSALNNDAGASNTGAAYLVRGPFSGSHSLANADAKLVGAAGDKAGGGLSGVGDVDGDGLGDFLVGSPFADDGGTDSGAVYLVFGPVEGVHFVGDVAAATYVGEAAGDEAGWGLASAADHDGDGLTDFLISAQKHDIRQNNGNEGSIYLVTQRTSGVVNLSEVHAVLHGEAVEDQVSNCDGDGDFNGDGNPDIMVNSRFNDETGVDAGAVYLVPGPLASGEYEVEHAAATKFQGMAAGDGAGAPVDFPGDVNGDGLDDVIMGSRWRDVSGQQDVGEAYIFFGTGF